MRHRWIVVGFCAIAAACASALGQSYKIDVGYTRLAAEDQPVPNGAGVPVTQIEATLTNNGDDYFPDTTNAEFTGKTLTPEDSPYSTSGHATEVGEFFYGNDTSMTPGITSVNVYNANDWYGTDFLNAGSASLLPDYTTDRVANHSYIGYETDDPTSTTEDPALTLDALHRIDYVIQHDDYINVVACNNPGNGGPYALLADSFNAITVGLTAGDAASGTTGELDDPQGLYVAGRAAPDVVAPMDETSFATPIVSSTAALLVEVAHDNPDLSYGSFTSPRTGLQLEYGETNDVIKAAIMAGADRVTSNVSTTANITDFGDPAYATQNGLDTRYGAGQVDVYNSYNIIAAGQHGPGTIGTYGFDYNPTSSDTATEDYTFTGHYGIAATLAWNIHIDDSLSATLAHFQLQLFDLSTGGGSTSIAVSDSMIDNTQNIFALGLNTADTYELQVTRSDDLGDWDYGLAWDLAPAPEPGAAGACIFVAMALLSRRNPKPEIRNPKQIPMTQIPRKSRAWGLGIFFFGI
jgi:hypothetical protein